MGSRQNEKSLDFRQKVSDLSHFCFSQKILK
jgi:hypothetical protein